MNSQAAISAYFLETVYATPEFPFFPSSQVNEFQSFSVHVRLSAVSLIWKRQYGTELGTLVSTTAAELAVITILLTFEDLLADLSILTIPSRAGIRYPASLSMPAVPGRGEAM